jgi:hypothetical protein
MAYCDEGEKVRDFEDGVILPRLVVAVRERSGLIAWSRLGNGVVLLRFLGSHCCHPLTTLFHLGSST